MCLQLGTSKVEQGGVGGVQGRGDRPAEVRPLPSHLSQHCPHALAAPPVRHHHRQRGHVLRDRRGVRLQPGPGLHEVRGAGRLAPHHRPRPDHLDRGGRDQDVQ